jgi:hypothetical protein
MLPSMAKKMTLAASTDGAGERLALVMTDSRMAAIAHPPIVVSRM